MSSADTSSLNVLAIGEVFIYVLSYRQKNTQRLLRIGFESVC